MRHQRTSMIGAALLAFSALAGSAEAQIISQPCETCGVELGKALPEGVTFLDLEDYGQRDGQGNRLGVNIPTTAWSTPFSFYNTRLEVLAIVPVFTHIDGVTTNRVDFYASSIIVGGAHDFGSGFNAAIFAGPRSGDNFNNIDRGLAADLRASVVYDKYGYQAIATLLYSGNFGGLNTTAGTARALYNDSLILDYTLLKKFGKFELGVVGYAQEDISGPIPIRPGSVAVGGLVGYDFGKFQVQAYVTREVAIRAGGYGLGPTYVLGGANGGEETRGYFRFTLPLYKAPDAMPMEPIKARF